MNNIEFIDVDKPTGKLRIKRTAGFNWFTAKPQHNDVLQQQVERTRHANGYLPSGPQLIWVDVPIITEEKVK